jgi:hypothetical protein
MVIHWTNFYTTLFPDFTSDSLFKRLSRLKETSKTRIKTGRESLLPAHQSSLAVLGDDSDNNNRIRSRIIEIVNTL